VDVDADTFDFSMERYTDDADALSTSSKMKKSQISAPKWSFSNDTSRAVGETAQCRIQFQVPYPLGPGVFMYYKLTNL
jgi:hypothetical protein